MIEETIRGLCRTLPAGAREEFGEIEQELLRRSFKACRMPGYPDVVGDAEGERCSGDMICEVCGQDFYHHPFDWRVIGYGNVPFLNVLCSGRRVKL